MTAVSPPLMTTTRTAAIGGLLIALGSTSMALYTPAMPTLVAAFATTMAMVKTTLTAYFAGFALTQLVCGPLSDAYGRRPIAFAFLGIYVAGSLAAMLASSIEILVAARFLQGVGAAVGIAVSRAIVRDLFTGAESAKVMNTIGIALAIGPAIAPTLGGLILEFANWHALFIVMAVVGVAALAVVQFALPETNAHRDPGHAHPRRVVATYGRLLRDRRFLVPAVTMGTSVGTIYTLGTLLPFVLIGRVGMNPMHFGLGMLAQTGSYFVGGLVARQLLRHHPADRLVMPGLILAFAGAAATLLLDGWIAPSYAAVMIPVGVFAFAVALILPALTTSAMAPFAEVAGSASALMGFIQMGGGFLGGLAGALFADPVTAFATVFPAMLALALATQVVGRMGSGSRVGSPPCA